MAALAAQSQRGKMRALGWGGRRGGTDRARQLQRHIDLEYRKRGWVVTGAKAPKPH